jgi:GNAT superfamily N-acetyltransferase
LSDGLTEGPDLPRGWTISAVPFDDARAATVVAELGAEYDRRYGPNGEMARTTPSDFDPPVGIFLVVTDDADVVAAGGGLIRVTEAMCEVKRMWVDAAFRRRGLASRVLAELEAIAAGAGYTVVRLETGPLQPEAAALYGVRGYERIPVFGPYPNALAFEKRL